MSPQKQEYVAQCSTRAEQLKLALVNIPPLDPMHQLLTKIIFLLTSAKYWSETE